MSADPSPQASRKGSQLDSGPPSQNEKSESDQDKGKDKPNVFKRFALVFKKVIFHSWINLLLVFVPVGIAVNFVPGMSPGVIFAMNAIAIVPLAGLLSHATETVAHRFGDAIGALMNVTFGNAVELIILYVIARHVLGRWPCREAMELAVSLLACGTWKTPRLPDQASLPVMGLVQTPLLTSSTACMSALLK